MRSPPGRSGSNAQEAGEHVHIPYILLAAPLLYSPPLQEMGDISEALKRHEGCNIEGWLDVARVQGNVHFAVRPEALFLSTNVAEIMEVGHSCL